MNLSHNSLTAGYVMQQVLTDFIEEFGVHIICFQTESIVVVARDDGGPHVGKEDSVHEPSTRRNKKVYGSAQFKKIS